MTTEKMLMELSNELQTPLDKHEIDGCFMMITKIDENDIEKTIVLRKGSLVKIIPDVLNSLTEDMESSVSSNKTVH